MRTSRRNTGSGWKRCSTSSRASWTWAATSRSSAMRTMRSSRGSIRAGRSRLSFAARDRRGAVRCGRISGSRPARFDDKSRWLLGDAAAEQFACAASPAQRECRCGANFQTAATTCSDEFRNPARGAHRRRRGAARLSVHRRAWACRRAVVHVERRRARAADRSRDVRVSHAEAMARLFPRHVGSQHRARRRSGPVGRSGGNFLWLSHAPVRVLEFSLDGAVRTPRRGARWLSALAGSRHASARVASRARDLRVTVVDEMLCRGRARSRDVLAFRGRLRSDARWRTVIARNGGAVPRNDSCRRGSAAASARSRKCAARVGVAAFDQRSPTSTLLVRGTTSGNAAWSRGSNRMRYLAKNAKGAKADPDRQDLGGLGVFARAVRGRQLG